MQIFRHRIASALLPIALFTIGGCGDSARTSSAQDANQKPFNLSIKDGAFSESFEAVGGANLPAGTLPSGSVARRVQEEFLQVRSWYRDRIQIPYAPAAETIMNLELRSVPIIVTAKSTDLSLAVTVGALGCTGGDNPACKLSRTVRHLDARMKFHFDIPGVGRDIVYPELGDVGFSAMHQMKFDAGIKIDFNFLNGIGNEFIKKFLTFLSIDNKIDLGVALRYNLSVDGISSHELDYKRGFSREETLSLFQVQLLRKVLVPACKEAASAQGRPVDFCEKAVAPNDFEPRLACVLANNGARCDNLVPPPVDPALPPQPENGDEGETPELRPVDLKVFPVQCIGPNWFQHLGTIYFRGQEDIADGTPLFLLVKGGDGHFSWPASQPQLRFDGKRTWKSGNNGTCKKLSGEAQCRFTHAPIRCDRNETYVLSTSTVSQL